MEIMNQDQNMNCSLHQNNRVQFIQIKDIQDNKNLFYCQQCQNEDDDYKASNFILIDRMKEHNHHQILDKWPPFSDNSLNKKIKQYVEQKNPQSQQSSQIDTFFDKLKLEIIEKIDQTKKIIMINSSQFCNIQSDLLDKYQNISKIKEFKSIIFDNNIDVQQKQNEYRKLIQDLTSHGKKNSEIFEQIIQKHEQNNSLIDFQKAANIKSSIIELINQINNLALGNQTIDQLNDGSSTNKCQLLFDLISTKSNYCSETFLNSIQSLFNQISPHIQNISFEDVFIQDKKPIDFSKLNNEQLKQLRDLCECFKQMDNEQQDQIKNNYKIKQIMEILKSKANYLNGDFLIEFEKYLIQTFPFLNQVKFDQVFQNNSKIQIFQQISETTLKNIVKLTDKINELQNGNAEQTLKVKEQCYDIQNWYYLKEDLDNLYQNYPIFDLLNPKVIDILPQIQMITTNSSQSKTLLQIAKNQQNNLISISLSNDCKQGCYTNCVSDIILDQNTSYVFRFQFINNTQDKKLVCIGLVRDSPKDSDPGDKDNMSCFFHIYQNSFYSGSYGIDKKEKGDFSGLKSQEIEMRVCIKDNILQILDYPNYNHILSLDDKYKDNLKQYKDLRLYVGIFKQNIQIQITNAQKNN